MLPFWTYISVESGQFVERRRVEVAASEEQEAIDVAHAVESTLWMIKSALADGRTIVGEDNEMLT